MQFINSPGISLLALSTYSVHVSKQCVQLLQRSPCTSHVVVHSSTCCKLVAISMIPPCLTTTPSNRARPQFLSLLQNDLIRDMMVIYTDKLLHTVLRFGVPVCGHPTIVHGGLTSAIFDEVGYSSSHILHLSAYMQRVLQQ